MVSKVGKRQAARDLKDWLMEHPGLYKVKFLCRKQGTYLSSMTVLKIIHEINKEDGYEVTKIGCCKHTQWEIKKVENGTELTRHSN